jgi:hypothetical protein
MDSIIQTAANDYIASTNLLGIPRDDSKDQHGTVLGVLGYEVDTNTFTLRVPRNKLIKARTSATQAL